MMTSHLALVIFGVIAATFFSTSSLAFPTLVEDANGGGQYVVLDPDEYDDYVPPTVLMKRFFTNHPSDYNPMRRPGPIPRGAKREDGVPFHPVPRVMTTGMRHATLGGDDFADSEGYIESGRQKKQTRAATLIFRLGSLGMRRKPTVPPGPTTA